MCCFQLPNRGQVDCLGIGHPTGPLSTVLTAPNRRKASFARPGNRPRCRLLVAIAPSRSHWPPGSANAKVIVQGITVVGVRSVRTMMRSVWIA